MAVRFSADGQDYTRALSLGAITQFSVSCWIKISVNRSTFTTAWCIDNNTTDNYVYLQAGNGVAMALDQIGGSIAGARTLTVGTWYWWGVAINGTTVTVMSRAAADTSSAATSGATGSGGVTATTLRLGESVYTAEWLNGCMAAFKLWTGATLTQDELEAESVQYMPARTSGLRAWYPMLAPGTADYSGNAQTLSGGSGAATEDGPPIRWRSGRRRIISAAASTAVTASLDADLPALTGSAQGAVTVAGSLDAQLPALDGSAAGELTVAGQLDAELPALEGALTGETGTPGILNGTLPALTGSFAGQVVGGFLTADLPALTGTFDGQLHVGGQLDAALPALTGALTGDVEIPPHDISPTSTGPQRGWAARTPTNWATPGNATRGWTAGQPTT